MKEQQSDLWPGRTDPTTPPVKLTLEIRGTIPSFKNNKMIIPPSIKRLEHAVRWSDIETIRKEFAIYREKHPLVITKPEFQLRMNTIIASIVSQLRSAFQTSGGQTSLGSSIQSWIASCTPADDCWAKIPDIDIKGELCKPGEEGATITIERL